MIVSGLVCFILSNFISNTATAALLIPILTVVCAGMGDKLNTIGGTSTILIGVAVSASCAIDLHLIVGNIWCGIERKMDERNDAPDDEGYRENSHHQLVADGVSNQFLKHNLSFF